MPCNEPWDEIRKQRTHSSVPYDSKYLTEEEVESNRQAFIDRLYPPLDSFDPVQKPKHYNLNPYGIEAIDAINAATCDAKGEEAYYQGNCIKYLWRYRRKNGIEDLKKCKWYLEKLIAIYETNKR